MTHTKHALLQRQLKKLSLDSETLPDLKTWQAFLARVNDAYQEEDKGRYLLERSLQISSEEMRELNENLQNSAKSLEDDKAKLERWQLFHQQIIDFVADLLYQGFENDFYKRLLEYALRTFHKADAGSILLRTKDNKFCFVASEGFDFSELQGVSLSESELLVSPDMNPQIIHPDTQVYEAVLTKENRQALARVGRISEIKSTLFIPVLFENNLIALLSLDSFEGSCELDPETEAMAKVFAAQMAVLLQRYKLSDDLAASNQRLERLANYDVLTGLPNRAHFYKHLDDAIQQANQESGLALFFLDLDGFKLINDSLGHAAGDQLLLQAAQRITKCLRRSDLVARLGGDEFTIVLENLASPGVAIKIAEKVLHNLRQAFYIFGQEFKVTASIGIAYYPYHAKDAEALVKLADIAMYQAKSQGKNRFFLFSEELDRNVTDKMQLLRDMQQALQEDAFELYYQPRVNLKTGEVSSAEALLRWQHPERGFVSPVVFIPLAEESGMINALGDWVLTKVCAQIQAWHRKGIKLRLAANVSVHELQDKGFVAKVLNTIKQFDIPAELLELEITESTAMFNVELNIHKLEQLAAEGITLAIDDFGTAYSSLNYLKRLPVHCLKIDRSFVQDITESDSVNRAIVRSIIALAESMELGVVAEGVETLAQLEFLKAHNCDEAQGYFFSRPVPAEQLETYLHSLEAVA